MAGTNQSGRGKKSKQRKAGLIAGRWPWDDADAKPETWEPDKIRGHLERWFADQELVTSELARDAISTLAYAYYRRLQARSAIRDNPGNPKVGRMSAWNIERMAGNDIRASFKSLGLWPLEKTRGIPGASSRPGASNGLNVVDFRQPGS